MRMPSRRSCPDDAYCFQGFLRDAKLNLASTRIGYVPYSRTLDAPGDRRRFVHYARARGIAFEIADPRKHYDVVVLSSTADISVWSRYPNAKIVYEIIDSYLAIPRTDFKGRLRGLFKFLSRQSRHLQLDHWSAIAAMCRRADAVICSTEEQRGDILPFCRDVHVILDVQVGVTRAAKSDYTAHRPFRLVWEGLPQNLASLQLIRPALQQLQARYPLELHVVSDPHYFRHLGRYGKADTLQELRSALPEARFHEWNETDCARIICACDLAVIPLRLDDPFAAGKPENKLLLFWRMGMPVVTSASQAYARAMQAAGMGYAVRDAADWLPMLERLLGDENARRDAGMRGKAYAERNFSEAVLLSQWDRVFAGMGFSTGAHSDGPRDADLPRIPDATTP